MLKKYKTKLFGFDTKRLLDELKEVSSIEKFKVIVEEVLEEKVNMELQNRVYSEELIPLYNMFPRGTSNKLLKTIKERIKIKIGLLLLNEFGDFKKNCSSVMESKIKMDKVAPFMPLHITDPYTLFFKEKIKSLMVPLYKKKVLDIEMAMNFLKPYNAFNIFQEEVKILEFKLFKKRLFGANSLTEAKTFQYDININGKKYRLAREYIDLFYWEMYPELEKKVRGLFIRNFMKKIFINNKDKDEYESLEKLIKNIYRSDAYSTELKNKYQSLYFLFLEKKLREKIKMVRTAKGVLSIIEEIPDSFQELKKQAEKKYISLLG